MRGDPAARAHVIGFTAPTCGMLYPRRMRRLTLPVVLVALVFVAVGGGVASAAVPRDGTSKTIMVGTPDPATGTVTGLVCPSSASPLTYASTPDTPTNGSVNVSADGAFTYTPTATARHAAVATGAPRSAQRDSFTVTATDPQGVMMPIRVSVPISPTNSQPRIKAAKIRSVSPKTGKVAGSLTGTDADGDPLRFTLPMKTTPSGASLTMDPTSGAFTYTPTAAARLAASANSSTGAVNSETFGVTVADGHGGVVVVPVRVPIR